MDENESENESVTVGRKRAMRCPDTPDTPVTPLRPPRPRRPPA
jgi:hypothetical protein